MSGYTSEECLEKIISEIYTKYQQLFPDLHFFQQRFDGEIAEQLIAL